MAYLSREARREQIMNAVVDLVSRESLSAATVRRIAQETNISLGQIHHHFASADAMRAEAVREVWKRLDPHLTAALHQLPPRQRIVTLLAGDPELISKENAPFLAIAKRLWKEAWDIRQQEPVKVAIAEGYAKIHQEITRALEAGTQNGDFPDTLDITQLVLRLMAASQGYELLAEMGLIVPAPDAKLAYIECLMRREGL